MRPRLFALVEIPDHGLVANGKVCRFDAGPAQICIPVLRVPGAFACPVAHMLTANTPAVGGEVSDRRESSQVAGFQKNRQRQDRADAVDGLEQGIAEK